GKNDESRTAVANQLLSGANHRVHDTAVPLITLCKAVLDGLQFLLGCCNAYAGIHARDDVYPAHTPRNLVTGAHGKGYANLHPGNQRGEVFRHHADHDVRFRIKSDSSTDDVGARSKLV